MPSPLPKLIEDDMIDGSYKIVNKLGEGGFGAVYKVKDATGREYALKIESIQIKTQVLRMEVYVLEQLGQSSTKHFCGIFGKGKTDEFNYVVMTLVSTSLQDLRKARKEQHFTLSTAIRTGIQCLEGIEEMHRIGYLHRDIKPGNYAIGRSDVGEQKIVYILDFGLCRRFMAGTRMRTPRAKAAFRGTIRYAALFCHRQQELSPKDDVETWFYQQIEITKGALPWKHLLDKNIVGQWKENARIRDNAVRRDMFRGVPPEFEVIFCHLETLSYYTMPNYQKIYELMRRVAINNNITDAQPYDWEVTAALAEGRTVAAVSQPARPTPAATRPPPSTAGGGQSQGGRARRPSVVPPPSNYSEMPPREGAPTEKTDSQFGRSREMINKSRVPTAYNTGSPVTRPSAGVPSGVTSTGQMVFAQPKPISMAQMMAESKARQTQQQRAK